MSHGSDKTRSLYHSHSHARLPAKYTYGCLGPICFLVVVFYIVSRILATDPANPAERYMQRAQDSLRYYLKTVEDYLHGDLGVYSKDVFFCVTEDDKWWFEKNYQSVLATRQDLAKSPKGKRERLTPADLSLRVLLGRGPTQGEAEITPVSVGGTLATFKVRETYATAEGEEKVSSQTYVVDLVTEDSLWKVSGFCGARKEFK